MPIKVILGLPYLSSGALTATARSLRAPVLLSANSFARWGDDDAGVRAWSGWNLRQLTHADGLAELWLDSAGFVAQMAYRGFPWTTQHYIFGLCAQYPFTRFASLDCCVEQEIARDRDEVRERIAKTIALNRECRRWSIEAGIDDRLMHVIQGSTVDDYLSCFDRMHDLIGDTALIGVGSMCRRKANGDDGIVAIVEALDRRLPAGIQFHLFGLKSGGAEAVAMLDERVASIDSQAYGVRARRLAIERRQSEPEFSKSNAFVAGVMADWWRSQVDRMHRGQSATLQRFLPMPARGEPSPETVFDALIRSARADFNALIEAGDLSSDEIIPDAWIIDAVQDAIAELPAGVRPMDRYHGGRQLLAA